MGRQTTQVLSISCDPGALLSLARHAQPSELTANVAQALSPAEKRAAEKREGSERDREVLLDMFEAAKSSGHVRQTTLADRA